MSEVTPKPDEIVQAQVAAFAAERIGSYEDVVHVFDNIGSIAVGEAADITRVTDTTEYHRDADGHTQRVPEGTEVTVATTAEYQDFLRSVGGSRYEAIQGRAEMLKEYGRFEPTIAALRAELADPATRKNYPAFVGQGSNSMAFTIEEGDKSYIVRVPHGAEAKPSIIDSHLAGAVLGKGIPLLEQIVAASYENGVTVAEVVPGKEMGDLTVEDIQQVTDAQLGELADALIAANTHGIEIDPKPSNFLYDPEAGYGIIDYHSSKVAGKSTQDQGLGEIVGWAATPITNAGLYGHYKSNKTAEDYDREIAFNEANLGVLKRYRQVVAGKLQGDERAAALVALDEAVDGLQAAVDEQANPDWVADKLAEDERLRQQRAEQQRNSRLDDWMVL